MKLKLYQIIILLLSLSATTVIFPQPKKILIIADVGKLPDDSEIHISGNTNELGNWNEMLPMNKESRISMEFCNNSRKG